MSYEASENLVNSNFFVKSINLKQAKVVEKSQAVLQ